MYGLKYLQLACIFGKCFLSDDNKISLNETRFVKYKKTLLIHKIHNPIIFIIVVIGIDALSV